MNEQKELSLVDLAQYGKRGFNYLLKKWWLISLVALLFAVTGALYVWLQKPVYTAEITFAPESESNSGMNYAGIAAQFGFDIGGSSGSTFSGENLMHLFNSSSLIEKTLLTNVDKEVGGGLMVNYYIRSFELDKEWNKDDQYKNLHFNNFYASRNRVRDSIFKSIIKDITEGLQVGKMDKRADIISVKFSTSNEFFTKVFVEQLVNNVIDYYTDYKVKKARQNVDILQRQADSVSRLLSGNIQSIAVSNDLNVNPMRQTMRVGVQRRQIDVQVNGALYTELAKNLELAKLSLRKETPLIHIIDEPMLPLEKKKMGRFKAGLIFGLVGFILITAFLSVRRIFRRYNTFKY